LIPETRGGMLWRFALAAVVVIAFTASATAVAGLLEVKQITQDFDLTPSLKDPAITIPKPGAAQTILLVGSDHRYGEAGATANTDTMMLMRLNPKSSTINVLSIPRDLEVQIPEAGGLVTDKINAAYRAGGTSLLVKVLDTEVFPGLGKPNHIIDVNFGGFQSIVNALGCVYTDVDHRYYNNTAITDYSSIDIQPGYQKLCGTDALEFVRFRHTDSDLVREARQQDFIRWAKEQYGTSRLISEKDTLLKIFGKNTQSDHNLHTTDGIINLFDLALNMAGDPLKQVVFPADLGGPCGATTVNPVTRAVTTSPCYVTALASAEQKVFKEFMTPTTKAAAAPAKNTHGKRRSHKSSTAGLIADATDGQAQAGALGNVRMPVYYPAMIEAGTQYCSSLTANCAPGDEPGYEYTHAYPRKYEIHASGGGVYPAYRMTLVKNSLLGQYYGVQGTTWKNPPLLENPTQTEDVNGKQLMEFFQASKMTLVAWQTSSGTYWISNTLTDDIPNRQLVAIAASLRLAKP
jgi:LCP family protein required for cell wall assembly